MKLCLGATALAATAALAVPAVAGAHPSVYPTYANVIKPGTTNEIEEQSRFLVINHGYSYIVTEDNGLNSKPATDPKYRNRGIVGYNLIPGAWSEGKSFAVVMGEGATDAQPHATCFTDELMSEPTVKAWQSDVFYNYIPFQLTSAKLDDKPETWLPTLQAKGVDITKLGNATDAAAECARLGGVYNKADKIQTEATSFASGAIAAGVAPVKAEVETLTKENAALKATVFQTSPLQSQVAALTKQVDTLKRAMTVTLSKVSAAGTTAKITGQPASKVTVVLSLTPAQADKLGLKSTTLAKKTVTTAADGSASTKLTLSSAAKQALKKFKGSVVAEATSGDRFATAKGKFTR